MRVLLSILAALTIAILIVSGTRTHTTEVVAQGPIETPEHGGFDDLTTLAQVNAQLEERIELEADLATANETRADFSELRGHLVDAWGQPLSDCEVKIVGTPARDKEYKSETEPAAIDLAIRTDESGRFAVFLQAPAIYEWTLRTKSAGHASREWRFGTLEHGTSLDLGEITLQRAATLVGTVRDSRGELAGAGWTLHAWSKDPSRENYEQPVVQKFPAAHCETKGVFELTGLPPGELQLVGELDGGYWVLLEPVTLQPGETREVDLELPAEGREREIIVQLVPPSAALDVRIPNASVALTDAFGGTHRAVRFGNTFRFGELEQGRYQLSVDDPRFEWTERLGLEPGDARLRVPLQGSAAIQLDVRDLVTRAPISNWSLRLAYAAKDEPRSIGPLQTLRSSWMSSSTDGYFGGIVPAPLWLFVAAPGYAEQRIPIAGLSPLETRTLNVRLQSSKTLTGVVVTESGTPCATALVELYGNAFGVIETITNADGRFRIEELQPGHFQVRALASGGRISAAKPVELSPDTATPPVELGVVDGSMLRGTLRPRGFTRLSQCELVARLSLEGMVFEHRAPIADSWEFEVGPFADGLVRLSLAFPPCPFELELSEVRVPQPEEFALDLFGREPGELTCAIKLPGEQALLQVEELELLRDGDAESMTIPFPAQGLVELGPLPPGTYHLRSRGFVRGMEGEWVHEFEDAIELQSGERPIHEFLLPVIAGELSVRSALFAQPLADTWISLTRVDGPTRATLHARTDREGLVRLELPPGQYALSWKGEAPSEQPATILDWTTQREAPRVIALPY